MLPITRLTVNRAVTAALLATAAQIAEQPQLCEGLLHRYLLANESEVHLRTWGGFR